MNSFVIYTKKGSQFVMINTKVCVLAGKIGPKEFFLLEKYAREGCRIALMDRDKQMGMTVKEELEKSYNISVFFFHGDTDSEEDRDLFSSTVKQLYGQTDYIICSNK